MNKYFGDKAFYRSVMSIVLPIMAQQLVECLVELVDNIMIGSVGSIALTSISITNKFFFLYNSTLFGICGAVGIFIAQYYGSKDLDKCQKSFDIGLLASIFFGILFTLVAFIMPEMIISLFTKTASYIEAGVSYLKYIKFSFIPYGISMVTMMSLRPVGINHIQLKIGMTSVLTNAILNYLLIFGHFGFPQLGIEGAAIATLIARLLEMSIYLYLLMKKQHFFELHLRSLFHIDLDLGKKILVKAIPLTINEVLFTLANTLVFKSYMRVDEFLVAAIAVVDTVVSLAFVMIGGLSNAISILTGNKLGANEIEEAKSNALKLIVFGELIAFVTGSMLLIIAPFIPNLYNLEAEINQTIITLIRLDGCFMPAYIFNSSIFFILRAGGDTTSTLIMDSGYLWVINVSTSMILSIYTTLPLVSVYAIVEGLNYGKSILGYLLYHKGNWAKNITLEN